VVVGAVAGAAKVVHLAVRRRIAVLDAAVVAGADRHAGLVVRLLCLGERRTKKGPVAAIE
jgi:hypothetical protein